MNGGKTARAGDRLHIPGRPSATILVGGNPPYRVVYDGGKTAMVIPGPDAVLQSVPFAEVAAGLPEPKPRPPSPVHLGESAGASAGEAP